LTACTKETLIKLKVLPQIASPLLGKGQHMSCNSSFLQFGMTFACLEKKKRRRRRRSEETKGSTKHRLPTLLSLAADIS